MVSFVTFEILGSTCPEWKPATDGSPNAPTVPSLSHDQMQTFPSFILADSIRSPAFEYIISVTEFSCPRKLLNNLSVEGAEREQVDKFGCQQENLSISMQRNRRAYLFATGRTANSTHD